jgi:opacity protein-like surface antigen
MVIRVSALWLAVAILCSVLSSPAALAADIPPSHSPNAVVFEKASVSNVSFSPAPVRQLGCYAGIFGEAVVSHPELVNIPVPGAYSEYFAKGARGGGVLGCDLVFQTRMFLGLELTAAYGQLKGEHAAIDGNVPFEGTARLRFGFFLDPDVSVYIAGGGAHGYLTTTEKVTGVTTSGYITGGQVATGIEYRFAPNWRARLEYAYTYYGSDSLPVTGSPLGRMNPTSHSLRTGLLWVFWPY